MFKIQIDNSLAPNIYWHVRFHSNCDSCWFLWAFKHYHNKFHLSKKKFPTSFSFHLFAIIPVFCCFLCETALSFSFVSIHSLFSTAAVWIYRFMVELFIHGIYTAIRYVFRPVNVLKLCELLFKPLRGAIYLSFILYMSFWLENSVLIFKWTHKQTKDTFIMVKTLPNADSFPFSVRWFFLFLSSLILSHSLCLFQSVPYTLPNIKGKRTHLNTVKYILHKL